MRATIVAISRNKSRENGSSSNKNKNNNQEAASTRPRPSKPPLRPPLQSSHHNVMVRNAQLTAKSGNAADNMASYEKQNRPLMPPLSASAAKTANRTPLTPRVAGLAPATATTPAARRGARLDNNTPPVAPSREDLSTPVSTFLSNNITPRSGSRRTRVDSTHTTPTGTPNGTPLLTGTTEPFRTAGDVPTYGLGLGIGGSDKDVPKRATVSFSPAVLDVGNLRSPAQSIAGDSKFFFASQAKSVQAPRPQLQPKNSPTFFYANGNAIPPPPQSPSALAVGLSVGEERSQPKFFHANGTPDLQASPSPHFPPPRPSSILSTNSRMPSPRLAPGSSGTLSPPQRPVSPQKLNQLASIPSLRSSPSLPSPLVSRPQPQGRAQPANIVVAARRASNEIKQTIISHSRSASADSKTASQRISSGSSTWEASAPTTPLAQVTTPLPVSTPEELPEGLEPTTEDAPSELQSPTKVGHSFEHIDELAASARRERKVLDLEITNSSLAAINRTLEREMRKQTAELRRYRRLSRSGRLSIATTASMRTSSGNLSIMEGIEGVEGAPLSDMSEEESEADSSFSSSEEDSLDDGTLSPGAMAESDLRHRKKDEKRLLLDLSKHQQLLVDSQKMNQSLKRCLGWTEELINEGKKALAYQVRVSDVELGGRVLAPDEVEGEGGDTEGLGEVGVRMLQEARLAAANGTTVVGLGGDRDSGVDLEGGVHKEHIESLNEFIT